MRSAFDGLISSLGIDMGRISEPEDVTTETSQSEMQRGGGGKQKEKM